MPTTDEILLNILARLDRNEVVQKEILDFIRNAGPIRTGPFQGQTPGAPEVIDESTAQPVLDALNLGSDGPSAYEVARLLAHGYTAAEVIAEAERLLASTGLPRDKAAFALNTKSHGIGWQMLTNRVEGKPENPIFSHDPAGNLLDGISTANGPADMEPLVPEVIARAEQGVTWRGTRGLDAADLALAKAALADPAQWRPEWRGWVDPKLREVLVKTGRLPVKWEGAKAMQQYPDCTTYAVQTVAEWLYGEWIASR